MKKVIGTIIMMAILFTVIFTATAEVSSESFTTLDKYLEENHLSEYKKGFTDCWGVYCSAGVVNTQAFMDQYGYTFTQENIEKCLSEEQGTEFAVLLAKIGEQDGVDIYSLQLLAQMDLVPGVDGTQVALELICVLV